LTAFFKRVLLLYNIFYKKMNKQRGIAQIAVMIIMLVLAVALPVTTKLVQQSQENRGKATDATPTCPSGWVHNDAGSISKCPSGAVTGKTCDSVATCNALGGLGYINPTNYGFTCAECTTSTQTSTCSSNNGVCVESFSSMTSGVKCTTGGKEGITDTSLSCGTAGQVCCKDLNLISICSDSEINKYKCTGGRLYQCTKDKVWGTVVDCECNSAGDACMVGGQDSDKDACTDSELSKYKCTGGKLYQCTKDKIWGFLVDCQCNSAGTACMVAQDLDKACTDKGGVCDYWESSNVGSSCNSGTGKIENGLCMNKPTDLNYRCCVPSSGGTTTTSKYYFYIKPINGKEGYCKETNSSYIDKASCVDSVKLAYDQKGIPTSGECYQDDNECMASNTVTGGGGTTSSCSSANCTSCATEAACKAAPCAWYNIAGGKKGCYAFDDDKDCDSLGGTCETSCVGGTIKPGLCLSSSSFYGKTCCVKSTGTGGGGTTLTKPVLTLTKVQQVSGKLEIESLIGCPLCHHIAVYDGSVYKGLMTKNGTSFTYNGSVTVGSHPMLFTGCSIDTNNTTYNNSCPDGAKNTSTRTISVIDPNQTTPSTCVLDGKTYQNGNTFCKDGNVYGCLDGEVKQSKLCSEGQICSSNSANTSATCIISKSKCMVCKNGRSRTNGDANCDGKVDGLDYSVWRQEAIDGQQSTLDGMTGWWASFNCRENNSSSWGATDLTNYTTWNTNRSK
jgi:hypothetical protein